MWLYLLLHALCTVASTTSNGKGSLLINCFIMEHIMGTLGVRWQYSLNDISVHQRAPCTHHLHKLFTHSIIAKVQFSLVNATSMFFECLEETYREIHTDCKPI